MNKLLKVIYSDTKGATIVEYALLVALISIVVMTAVIPLGQYLQIVFLEASEYM